MTNTIRFATSNMFKRLTAKQSRRHVNKVLPLVDVVGWQEVTRVHRKTLIKKRAEGWETYFSDKVGGLAISWRADRFEVYREGRSHRAVPGIPLDPDRGFITIVLKDLLTGELWPIIVAHMTHQAWTSHPERRYRWWIQAGRLRWKSRRLKRRFGRMVGLGDVNRHHWAPKGTIGAWPAGGTLGRAKYDVIWRKGKVEKRGPIAALNTPSDHHTAIASLGAAA